MTPAAKAIREYAARIIEEESRTSAASPLWATASSLRSTVSDRELLAMYGGADESWNVEGEGDDPDGNDVSGVAWELIEQICDEAGL